MALRCSPSAARSIRLLRHEFEKAIDDVLADESRSVVAVIDLTEVTFLGSVGLRLLGDSQRAGRPCDGQRSGSASAVGSRWWPQRQRQSRPIELTDLNEVFDLCLSLDDALAAMRSEHRSVVRPQMSSHRMSRQSDSPATPARPQFWQRYAHSYSQAVA